MALGIDSYFSEFSLVPLAPFVSNPRTIVPFGDPTGLAHDVTLCTACDDQGWAALETVFVKLNTSFTPSGRFPVYSNESWLDNDGVETRIGYDAAVCVQRYEPWIVEAHNTSTGSNILRIAGKGDGSTSLSPSGNIRGARIANTRYLNTAGKGYAFNISVSASGLQAGALNDNWGDYVGDYTPSLSVGPVAPPRSTSSLTTTYSTGCFFDRRHWTTGIYRTLSRTGWYHPSTDLRGLRSTIPCWVQIRRRTVV